MTAPPALTKEDTAYFNALLSELSDVIARLGGASEADGEFLIKPAVVAGVLTYILARVMAGDGALEESHLISIGCAMGEGAGRQALRMRREGGYEFALRAPS